jgi:hypothetical protein
MHTPPLIAPIRQAALGSVRVEKFEVNKKFTRNFHNNGGSYRAFADNRAAGAVTGGHRI